MDIELSNLPTLLKRYADAGIKTEVYKNKIWFPDYNEITPLGTAKPYLSLSVSDGISISREYNDNYFKSDWKPILREIDKKVQFLYDYATQEPSLITMF
jgi:hypothetical protein